METKHPPGRIHVRQKEGKTVMAEEHTILVAEDDRDIAQLIRMYLTRYGYRVLLADNGIGALELLRSESVSLAILDVMMPGMDGFELTRQLRTFSNIPLIILSARTKEEDRICGLDLGADVYMSKPFRPDELMAQVQASLRRYYRLGGSTEPEAQKYLRIGDLCVDLEQLTLTRDGELIPLTSTELKILVLLMKTPGRVYTKAQLYRAINGDWLRTDDNTMMVHISNLREKIERDPKKPVYIKTIRGIGYKLDGKTETTP